MQPQDVRYETIPASDCQKQKVVICCRVFLKAGKKSHAFLQVTFV
jgi:hypothetical protein